jgi:hypothetical protein
MSNFCCLPGRAGGPPFGRLGFFDQHPDDLEPEVVHEVYDLAISDNHGGITHQQVLLNLSHYPLTA